MDKLEQLENYRQDFYIAEQDERERIFDILRDLEKKDKEEGVIISDYGNLIAELERHQAEEELDEMEVYSPKDEI